MYVEEVCECAYGAGRRAKNDVHIRLCERACVYACERISRVGHARAGAVSREALITLSVDPRA